MITPPDHRRPFSLLEIPGGRKSKTETGSMYGVFKKMPPFVQMISIKMQHYHQCMKQCLFAYNLHMCCAPRRRDEKNDAEQSRICEFPHFEKPQIKKMTCSFFYRGIKRNSQTAVFQCTCIFLSKFILWVFRSKGTDVGDNKKLPYVLGKGNCKKEKGGIFSTDTVFIRRNL